jgi:hypothetical protein
MQFGCRCLPFDFKGFRIFTPHAWIVTLDSAQPTDKAGVSGRAGSMDGFGNIDFQEPLTPPAEAV